MTKIYTSFSNLDVHGLHLFSYLYHALPSLHAMLPAFSWHNPGSLFAGGKAAVPADASSREIEKWLEWEACCLKPATYLLAALSIAQDPKPFDSALAHLSAAVKGKQCLVGSSLTAADVGAVLPVYTAASQLTGSCHASMLGVHLCTTSLAAAATPLSTSACSL